MSAGLNPAAEATEGVQQQYRAVLARRARHEIGAALMYCDD